MNKVLDEIQARTDAATEGPWVEFHENGEPGELEAFNCPPATGAFMIEYGADRDQQQRDANFIAAAREDVPKLVAALRAVEVLAEQWRYKGEFGMGAWQEGHGPSPEGAAYDDAAAAIRGTISSVLDG